MLHLHTAPRIEPLAARLAEVLARAPADPMAPEWIAVPSVGMRRWLELELARHLGASGPGVGDGISANVTPAFPGELRLAVLRSGRTDDDDPWSIERLVWSVLAVADAAAPEGGSRYASARRTADLFDRYHVHRADMVRSWAEGQDLDGSGRPLAAHHRWQPLLWRGIREAIGEPSPPERLPGLLQALHEEELDPDLPGRLIMFGLSLLPGGPGFLDLAEAVGAVRDLHVFLVEPSPIAAARIASSLEPPGDDARVRAEDRSVDLVDHPLLRSWGRLHRETTVLLADGERQGAPPVDRLRSTAEEPVVQVSLLEQLQTDLREDRRPAGAIIPRPDDDSIRFHVCHGPTRQVEVLRDVLLHLLSDEELALSEDDIVVLCPAIERFAPLVEAVLGPSADATSAWSSSTGAPPRLRYRVADRSLRTANPVLHAMEVLLELVGGRFEAPAVLDLIALEPVRCRFSLDEEAVARVGEWVGETNVKWGLDAESREAFGVPAAVRGNTWQAAIDRLFTGAAVTDDELVLGVGQVAPYGIDRSDAVIAGRLAELLWRLAELAEAAETPRSVGEWVELLRDAAGALFDTSRDDAWQVDALHRTFADIVDASGSRGDGSQVPLELVDVRRLLSDRLAGTPGRPDFFRGGITISSMTPLRWVPFRAVVLLGMDQAALGSGAVDGDDLAAALPLVGDRDRRAESRQSLLEAVLSARDRLVLLRDGFDVRTNQPVPPAVAVAELTDVVRTMIDEAARDEAMARLELTHPRQPFDDRLFAADELVPGGPWSFDPGALDGARARRRRTDSVPPFLDAPVPDDLGPVVDLADLHAFLKRPVKWFMTRRLGLRLPRREDGLSAILPVSLDPLERWKVGDRLLGILLDGGTVDDWLRVERRLGTLPPGSLGDRQIDEVTEAVDRLVEAGSGAGVRAGRPEPVAVEVALDDGTTVIGTVLDRLGGSARGPVRMSYSRGKAEYRVAAWLDLMALAGTDPSGSWRAVGVNRGSTDKAAPVVIDLVPRGEDPDTVHAEAVRALGVAVDLFRRGTAEPVPLFPALSPLLHDRSAKPGDWFHNMGFGDGDDVATSLAYPMDLEALRAIPALDGDPGDAAVESRAQRFADHLWSAIESSVATP